MGILKNSRLSVFRNWDPRYFQLCFIGLLFAFGVFFRDFSVTLTQAFLTFAAGLATQTFFLWRLRLKRVGLR